MNTNKVSQSQSSNVPTQPVKQIIPLSRLMDAGPLPGPLRKDMQVDQVGTVGTGIPYSNAHAEKKCISDQVETYFCTRGKVSEKPVPTVPSRILPDFPDLSSVFHCLDYGHPTFREPVPGELILGIYPDDNCKPYPILLWVDPNEDRFWDVGLREHVKPPRFYIQIKCQPEIDPASGYPVIQGAVCPF